MPKSIEFRFNSPDDSPGYLLWQVTMLWQRKIKKALDKLDITHTQFVLMATLAWLSKTNNVVTQIDIANHSNTDRMMVSKVLRTLQNKGYVGREEHETDTRAKSISLTKHGHSLVQKAVRVVEQVDNDFFAVLKSQAKQFNAGMLTLIRETGKE